MTIVELDTHRADTMRRLLNDTGRQEIWKYDIIESRQALREARANWNFDGMARGAEARTAGHVYALVGPGIEDHHFTTPAELDALLHWLCCESGYLSCYRADAGPEVSCPAC